jgi:hypothetical protein
MLQGAAHCRDGGINFFGRRVYEPGIGLRHHANFVGTSVKIDCGEHRMDECAEPASAWSLAIGTRDLL